MKKKLSKRKILVFSIFIISSLFIIIAAINFIKYKINNDNIEKNIKIIKENVKIDEIKDDNKNIEITNQVEEIPKSDPYWDFIKMNLINVDFKDLKSINSDTVGWIQVNGTNINYPFVQSDNNSFYLNHSFDKSQNELGWVFLDYRNDLSLLERNTIIYAHGAISKIMFGSLRNILNSSWVNNKDNYIVKLSTEYMNSLWQVFSVYKIPTTNDYIQTIFSDDDDFLKLANKLIERSNYNFNTSINENDKILTLSTCYNNNEKVVLHAKLIKKENKKSVGSQHFYIFLSNDS